MYQSLLVGVQVNVRPAVVPPSLARPDLTEDQGRGQPRLLHLELRLYQGPDQHPQGLQVSPGLLSVQSEDLHLVVRGPSVGVQVDPSEDGLVSFLLGTVQQGLQEVGQEGVVGLGLLVTTSS